jgi:hypothetical protein
MLGEILISDIVEWRGSGSLLVGYRQMKVLDFERGRQGKGPYTGYYWHGFQWSHRPDRPGYLSGESYGVRVPHWFVLFVMSLLPAARLLRHVRRTCRVRIRARQGRCLQCGYDVRATPDRCPECGAVAPGAGAPDVAARCEIDAPSHR